MASAVRAAVRSVRAGATALLAGVLVLIALTAGGCASRGGDRRPLTAADAAELDALVLRMMDLEALYTLASVPAEDRAGSAGGGAEGAATHMKPMSSGFFSARFPMGEGAARDETLDRVDRTRRLLAAFNRDPRWAGEYHAGVMTFDTTHEEKRSAEAFVIHTPTLRELLAREAAFFAPLGLTRHSHAEEVVAVIERAAKPERFRGYGLLFGYPAYAINFFVDAAAEGGRTGALVPRDFISIPTYEAAANRFVYAVPKSHVPNAEDAAMRARAEATLAAYREVRERAVRADDARGRAVLAELRRVMGASRRVSPRRVQRRRRGGSVAPRDTRACWRRGAALQIHERG